MKKTLSSVYVLAAILVMLAACSGDSGGGGSKNDIFTVSTSAAEGGTIEPASATVASGATKSFTVTPNSGYAISGVTGCNGSLSGNTYTTGPVTADCTVTASFAAGTPVLYTIGVSASPAAGGNVTGGGSYGAGSDVTVIATANTGYSFTRWTEGGTEVSTSGSYSFTAAADRTLAANFSLNSYTVSATGANGTITPASQTVSHGATTSFTVTPNSGYAISGVTGCNGSLSGNTYTTGPITADCAVTATFVAGSTPVLYTIGVSAAPSAGGTVTGGGSYGAGSDVTVIATANTGYSFTRWTEGGTEVSTSASYSFTANANRTLVANFAIHTYTLTYGSGAGGYIEGNSPQTVSHGGSGAPAEAVPSSNYHFVNWSDGVTANPRTDTNVTADVSVTANFAVNGNYTIGGTVNGLSGGLVLQNNGGNDLTINSNDYFIFTTAIAYGTTYEVTIKTQPTDQQCSVVGGSGTATANVTTVKVQCFTAMALDANPLSKTVTLSWNDVGATSYDLYYSTSSTCDIDHIASCPGGAVVTGVTSPYTVTSLTNGQHYTFWLKANHAAGHTTLAEIGARPARLGTNASVKALATGDDGTVYLGGNFTSVSAMSGSGVPLYATPSTGTRPFPVVNGAVKAVVPDGSGGWYIGGDFTRVGSEIRNRLAHVLADGSVGTWNPDANNTVSALSVSGSTVYVGGSFTTIGTTTRNRLAAINTSGTLDGTWDPNANNTVSALSVSGSTVYVGGSFTTIGTTTRNRLAAINTSGTLDGTWNPNANDTVYALAVSGSSVYVGGSFTTIGTVTRNRLAAIGTSGTLGFWTADANGTVYALAVSGSWSVYVGGSFTTIGTTTRNHLAKININTDGTASLDLARNAGTNDTIYALAVSGSNVYVGGNFTTAGRVGTTFQDRNGLAAFDGDSYLISSWNPNANSTVSALAVSGSTVYAGGSFTAIGGASRNRLAAIDSAGMLTAWNPGEPGRYGANDWVYTLAVSGSTVYVGGTFTTIGWDTCRYLAFIGTDGMVKKCSGPNSWVNAIAVSGSTVYVGGAFTTFDSTPRNYLLALDTSATLTSWNPNPPLNASVYDIAVDGLTVYVGGYFTGVGAEFRNHLAAFDSNGTLISWDPNANGIVTAVAVSGSTVYAGGGFTTIGVEPRNRLAAIGTNGTLGSWNPNAGNGVLALAVSGSTIYVGGGFTTIGGVTRNRLAAIDTNGTLGSWAPNANGEVNAIAISGSTVYVGGEFTTIGSDLTCNFAAVTP